MTPVRPPATLVLGLVMSMGLAGCDSGGRDASPATTTTTSSSTTTTAGSGDATTTTVDEAEATLAASCTHEERGVAVVIRYPGDWHTNEGDTTVPCSAFDPAPIELRRGTEFPPDLGAVVRVEPVGFARASRPSAERVENERRATVDGREAVRLEVVSTGEALRPEGERSVRWVIDAGAERTIFAHTSDVAGNDFGASTRVLDRMVDAFDLR